MAERTPERNLSVCQHEATHIVVGVSLGLKMTEAVVLPVPTKFAAYVWFPRGPRLAMALMYAAGVAWELKAHGSAELAHYDMRSVRLELKGLCRGSYAATIAAAGAMLGGLGEAHAIVTRALAERDLKTRDIEALARGERFDASSFFD